MCRYSVEGRTQYRRPGFGDYAVDAPCDTLGRSGLHADFQRGIGRERLPAPAHNPFKSVAGLALFTTLLLCVKNTFS